MLLELLNEKTTILLTIKELLKLNQDCRAMPLLIKAYNFLEKYNLNLLFTRKK